METVVKHASSTKHPWLMACDANMCPADFEKSLWFKGKHMFIMAPEEGVSTCRSKRPNEEVIERTYDYVIASSSLKRKSKKNGSG